MTDEQIKRMVEQFLRWKLPENFHPDGGISFEPFGNKGTSHQYKREPVGTNLLDYEQATAIVRYMIEGLRESSGTALGTAEASVWIRTDAQGNPDSNGTYTAPVSGTAETRHGSEGSVLTEIDPKPIDTSGNGTRNLGLAATRRKG